MFFPSCLSIVRSVHRWPSGTFTDIPVLTLRLTAEDWAAQGSLNDFRTSLLTCSQPSKRTCTTETLANPTEHQAVLFTITVFAAVLSNLIWNLIFFSIKRCILTCIKSQNDFHGKSYACSLAGSWWLSDPAFGNWLPTLSFSTVQSALWRTDASIKLLKLLSGQTL